MKRSTVRLLLVVAVVVAALIFSSVALMRYDKIAADVAQPAKFVIDDRTLSDLAPEQRVAVLLEQQVIERRYEQARAVALSKLWTRNMGFVTGMLLALLGAGFVLGELRVDPAEVSGAASALKIAISTTSPGLVLTTVGVALIAISLSITYNVSAVDTAVYFHSERQAAPSSGPPPQRVDMSADDGEASEVRAVSEDAAKKLRQAPHEQ